MMDGQQGDKKEIPVNARAVGNPMGMNVLYLEDYVHTFIKKLIKNEDDESGCEVFLYGYEFDEEKKHFFVVSGAYQHESRYDRPEKVGMDFFAQSQYLGLASIHSDGVSEMNMEIIREGTRSLTFKNFYIYYDQNEEMQNYLIEWNLEHREYRSRAEREDNVRYGRIAQAYNKEEVRVGFLWNAMNVLSIGFVVCIVVYGIISINNYYKMKNMEDKISYIVTTIAENQDFIEAAEMFTEQGGVFQTEMIEEALAEESMPPKGLDKEENDIEEERSVAESVPAEWIQEEQKIEVGSESTVEEEAIAPDMTEVSAEATSLAETTTVPQYYVVQQGDTMRSICVSVYGNLDRVEEVCLQNGITNPDSILCGQTLLLP